MFAFSLVMLAAQVATAEPNRSAPAREHVEIVLYSDFQCPYCKQLAPSIRKLQTQPIDGMDTTVRFKNFPLPMHANAQLAHQAAEAARAQGKFWEMHDLLFEDPRHLQRSDFIDYAKRLGLDIARFEKDLDSDRTRQLIAADVAEGMAFGVSGTPTYTINGKRYSGARSLDQLKDLITHDQRRARALAEVTDDLMAKGPSNAPVTLELFVDLQSPVSRPALDVIERVLRQHEAAVRVQFRNFPLAFHPQAELAHEAAMVAARDGHFWEFAAFILDRQGSLREQDLIDYAGRLGFDEEKFAEAIQQHRYAPRVEADLQAGQARGIHGSPVILVNGKRIDGVPSVQALTQYVEDALDHDRALAGKRP
jgi:protein-disulfide isomerase